MSKKKRNSGRPSKYETHVEPKLEAIATWARNGLSEEQIAENLGVAYSTFREYKRKYSALSAVLKNSKDVANAHVENALFLAATGYTKTIRKPVKVKEILYENGKRVSEIERIEYAEEEVYFPPVPSAMFFWLKNKMKDDYADNPQMVDIKREELKFRKEQAELANW